MCLDPELWNKPKQAAREQWQSMKGGVEVRFKLVEAANHCGCSPSKKKQKMVRYSYYVAVEGAMESCRYQGETLTEAV
jgi:hypothetical protein